MSPWRRTKLRRFITASWLIWASLFLACSSAASAQTAGDLTFHIFAKPEQRQLHVLIRVPFLALNGVSIPASAAGQLDLVRTSALLPSITRWRIVDNIDIYQGGMLSPKPQVVAARVSLPSDNSFDSYEAALAHLRGPPLPADIQLFRDQAMLDVLLDYDLPSMASNLAIHSRLASLASHATTRLEFVTVVGPQRRYEFTADPGLFYPDPSITQASRSFANFGFWRILGGSDYLLLLFCIALLLTGVRALASFAAVFAASSSIWLLIAVYNPPVDALWFPLLVETLIALSILYMAFENIAGGRLIRRKWKIALGLGIICGAAFAISFEEMRQFAGAHPLASLISFGAGLELAVLMALSLIAIALHFLFRATAGRVSSRTETIVLSVLAADLAWHRFTDRAERLSQFRFQWPVFDAALLASGLRWLMALLIAAGLASGLIAFRKYWTARGAAAITSSRAKRRPDPIS